MKRDVAKKLSETTKNSYDQMAREFSDTRTKFWEELEFLAEHATPGMQVIDIGCGNGRFLGVLEPRQIVYTGVDNSTGLLAEAKRLHPNMNFVEGDATALPFLDKEFDIAFSFATIHHIASKKMRALFVREAARVLKPRSTLILTTWDLRQRKYLAKYLLSFIMHWNPFSRLDAGDIMLTFGRERRERYVHAFTEKELQELLQKNGFTVIDTDIVVRQSGSGQKNILVIAKKK